MAKIMLTDKEKALLRLYIDFLENDGSPCEKCSEFIRRQCTGCDEHRDWVARKKPFSEIEAVIEDYSTLRTYVEASVAVDRISGIIKELEKRKTELGQVLEKCIKELNLEDGYKRIELYCEKCDLSFMSLKEKCKRCENLLHTYYYPCPKCAKICFVND